MQAPHSAMHTTAILETSRLILRPWRETDHEAFARMNADPQVMEFFPARLTRSQSDALVTRIEAHFRKHGFGLFAAESRQDETFAGFIGVSVPSFRARFTPCIEIGWRLLPEFWGQGLAPEGAREVAKYAFEFLQIKELVSFTVPENLRSRRVMEKLGMTHDSADDFNRPQLPPRHPLRRHVLYRLRSGL